MLKIVSCILLFACSALSLHGKVKEVGMFHTPDYAISSTEQWEKIWVEPDEENVYEIYCEKKVHFKLSSPIDTLSLAIKANDSLLLQIVVAEENDTIELLIVGVKKLPNQISVCNKLYTLSKLWSEAKYNFVHLDKISFDWDSLYYAYIPQVMATKNDYEYTRLLKRFYASLQDGHTEFWGRSFDAFCDYVPITVNKFNDKFIITSIRKGAGIDSMLIGAEIITISGIPIQQYMQEYIYPYISASTQQSKLLSVNLFYGFKWQPFIGTAKKRDGSMVTLKLKHNGEATRTEQDKFYGIIPTYPEALIKLTYTPDSIAILSIWAFHPEEYVIDKIQKLAPQISKAKALIVDIRWNGGGSSGVAEELQSHFTKQNHFLLFGSQTRINNGYYRSQGNWREEYAPFFADTAYDYLDVDTIFVADTLIRFLMPTAVLISAYTFSAAEDFLINMYEVPDRPIFIGESTGGSTGSPLVLTDLPDNSEARICTLRSYFPYSKKLFYRQGIEPDIVVKQTEDDYFNQKDVVLETAIQYLQNKISPQR